MGRDAASRQQALPRSEACAVVVQERRERVQGWLSGGLAWGWPRQPAVVSSALPGRPHSCAHSASHSVLPGTPAVLPCHAPLPRPSAGARGGVLPPEPRRRWSCRVVGGGQRPDQPPAHRPRARGSAAQAPENKQAQQPASLAHTRAGRGAPGGGAAGTTRPRARAAGGAAPTAPPPPRRWATARGGGGGGRGGRGRSGLGKAEVGAGAAGRDRQRWARAQRAGKGRGGRGRQRCRRSRPTATASPPACAHTSFPACSPPACPAPSCGGWSARRARRSRRRRAPPARCRPPRGGAWPRRARAGRPPRPPPAPPRALPLPSPPRPAPPPGSAAPCRQVQRDRTFGAGLSHRDRRDSAAAVRAGPGRPRAHRSGAGASLSHCSTAWRGRPTSLHSFSTCAGGANRGIMQQRGKARHSLPARRPTAAAAAHLDLAPPARRRQGLLQLGRLPVRQLLAVTCRAHD